MARVSEKSISFRTKREMASDIFIALSSRMTIGGKVSVISDITWIWSEFHGKYKGCAWWSEEALLEHKSNPGSSFIHEHAVPKRVILESLLTMENPNEESIYDYLEKHCIGVVVTKREDRSLNELGLRSKMPEDWDGKDVFARYKKVGIMPNHSPHTTPASAPR